MHFHEEHPLETEVTASKYVAKKKQTVADKDSAKSESAKLDMSRFNGMTMHCPKEDCSFEAKVKKGWTLVLHQCSIDYSFKG